MRSTMLALRMPIKEDVSKPSAGHFDGLREARRNGLDSHEYVTGG